MRRSKAVNALTSVLLRSLPRFTTVMPSTESVAELSDELLRAMEELELFPPLIRYRIECEWESEDPEWEPEDEKK